MAAHQTNDTHRGIRGGWCVGGKEVEDGAEVEGEGGCCLHDLKP